jgi:hypothetical protein
MAKIYRTTDKVKYKLGELTVWISPLSLADKAELHQLMSKVEQGDQLALIQGSAFAIKSAVKRIEGLTTQDDTPYELEMDGDKLSDQSTDDLMNIDESNKLISLCAQLIGGMPKQLPEGVSLVGGDVPLAQGDLK